MPSDIYEDYPPTLTPEQNAYLVQTVKDWSVEHGLTVRPGPNVVSEEANHRHVLATNAPVTLFPSPFPESSFQQAKDLQKVYNEIYAAIANNETWLENILKELIEVDTFIKNLWNVHLAVKEEGYTQDLSLGMFRSDYMLNSLNDKTTSSLKQVEFNTMASSFSGLSNLVSKLHQHLATFPSASHPLAYPSHPLLSQITDEPSQDHKLVGSLPYNNAVSTLGSGLAQAHKAYGPSKSSPTLPLCILFLVQDHERNLFDQLALSTHVYDSHKIPTFRLHVSEILKTTAISSENPSRPLQYTPPSTPKTSYEATIVYFRALYAPTEYTGPDSWSARLHLERSAAIKCPSILLHLAGSKRVQQALTSTKPDHLKTLLPRHPESTLSSLRSTFAPQYSLEPNSPGRALAINPSTAENHVLKPQREGGGNNIYRSNIPPFLASIPEKDYQQYILMELIHPPSTAKNTALRSDGQVISGDVISELGIFGTCVWRRDSTESKTKLATEAKILWNEEGGFLLRTKGKENDEGGVAAGFSSLDSPVLYKDDL